MALVRLIYLGFMENYKIVTVGLSPTLDNSNPLLRKRGGRGGSINVKRADCLIAKVDGPG